MNTVSRSTTIRFMMAAFATLLAMMTTGIPIAGAQEVQPIRAWGVVYLDENDDGIRDVGEEPVTGAMISAYSGEMTISAETDETGTFQLELSLGTWELSLQLPDDWQVELVEPIILDLTEGTEGDQRVDFPLRVQGPEVEDQNPGDPLELSDPQDTSVDNPNEQLEPETNDGSDQLPEILPESGSTLHPVMVASFLTIGFLVVGAALLIYGRRIGGSK